MTKMNQTIPFYQRPMSLEEKVKHLEEQLQQLSLRLNEQATQPKKASKPKKERDPNKPTQPLNAYMRWKRDYKKTLKEKYKHITDSKEFQRMVSIEWYETLNGKVWKPNPNTDPIKDKGKKKMGEWQTPDNAEVDPIVKKYLDEYKKDREVYNKKMKEYNQKKVEEDALNKSKDHIKAQTSQPVTYNQIPLQNPSLSTNISHVQAAWGFNQ